MPGGIESATIGDLDEDDDLDVLVGQFVNSLTDRVASIHSFKWGATGLERSAPAALDPGARRRRDRRCRRRRQERRGWRRRLRARRGPPWRRRRNFDAGRDVPQLGYQNPATATRVTMAVGDLTADGRRSSSITDYLAHAVMVHCNGSTARQRVRAADGARRRRDRHARTPPPPRSTCSPTTPIRTAARSVVASITQPAHGTAVIAGGGVTYRPTADYCNDLGGGARHVHVHAQRRLHRDRRGDRRVRRSTSATPRPRPRPATAAPGSAHLRDPGTVPFIVGTPGDDVLVGTGGHDVLSGRGGDDCLFGRARDDRITGGTGTDLLDGDSGSDRLNGDAGDDKFSGGIGNDEITPGAGKDNGRGPGRRRHHLRARRDTRHDRLRRRPRQGEGRPQRPRQELRASGPSTDKRLRASAVLAARKLQIDHRVRVPVDDLPAALLEAEDHRGSQDLLLCSVCPA